MATSEKLERQIREKLRELNKAVEEARKYYTKDALPEGEIPNFFEIKLAFDTWRLKEIELEILLAKKYRARGWERALEGLKEEPRRLKKLIRYWKKRKCPSKKEFQLLFGKT